MNQSRGTFSVWLPLLSLMVWVALLAVPATLRYLRLAQIAHGSETAKFGTGQLRAEIQRSQFLPFALEGASLHHGQLLVSGNVPGFLMELLLTLTISGPLGWHPATMTPDGWRVVTWPIYSLPAWWLVGLGLDALLGWRRLRWGLLLTGTLFFVLFAVTYLGFQFELSPSDRDSSSLVAVWGFGMWSLLFAIFPAVWLRQRRTRDDKKAASTT